MKKVLFVEDDGIVYDEIKKELENNFDLVRVSSYAAATGRWEREGETFDCIVLDLQINPLGLNLIDNDKYAPLFGMAVLDAFTEGKSKEEKENIRKKTIIYSGYTGELTYKGFDVKNIEVIAKAGNSITDVVHCIKNICSRD